MVLNSLVPNTIYSAFVEFPTKTYYALKFLYFRTRMVFMRHYVNLVNQSLAQSYSFSSRDFSDVTLSCKDRVLMVDLLTLGLLYPYLATIIPPILQAPLAVLLPDHTVGELVKMIKEVTGGAGVTLEILETPEISRLVEASIAPVYVQNVEDSSQLDFKKEEESDNSKEMQVSNLEIEPREMNIFGSEEEEDFTDTGFMIEMSGLEEQEDGYTNQEIPIVKTNNSSISTDNTSDVEFIEIPSKISMGMTVNLIYQKKWKFLRNQRCGSTLFFYCARKVSLCKAKACAQIVTSEFGREAKYVLDLSSLHNNHNHPSEELQILLEKGKRALKDVVLNKQPKGHVNRQQIYTDFMKTWPETLGLEEKQVFLDNFPDYQTVSNIMWRTAKPREAPKALACDFCAFSTTEIEYIDRHMRIKHKDRQPYKCHKCKKNFQEKYQLKAHNNIVHKPSSRIETIDNNKTTHSPSSLLPKRVRTLSGVVG